jgi:beta-glucosidase
MDPRLFPKDFLWGASTAAHQVEGGNDNDWTEWELAHAVDLAKTAPKRLSWLPAWKRIKSDATDPENYVSGRGVDHYRRYEEDFDLLEDLNFNSFRFGIEWARIEPKEGAWNIEAVEHYRKYIASLNKRGIEPVMNIWHWTMPTWFTEKGAFEKKQNLKYFDRFVKKVAEEYGQDIRYVLTLNEPNTYTAEGYLNGKKPPQLKKLLLAFKVYRNLTKAHRRAYAILKTANPSLQVGIAMNMADNRPKSLRNPFSIVTAHGASYVWNNWFVRRIGVLQDFIGINYYNTNYFNGFAMRNPTTPVNDLGWYMEPEGLYHVLMQAHIHFKKPIMVTENGVCDERDRYRRWWIEQTLIAMQRAISQGVDLKGYMHWSLLDNFEWESGWWPKFGLVAVDRKHNMQREPRPSAKWFGNYLGKLRQIQNRTDRT